MAGELQYRPFPYDDWGMIRNADGSMFATVRRTEAYEGEFDQHREEETDPFAELARRVIFFEALERENAALRAERDEARKAAIDQAVQVALDHAEGAIRLSKLADADGDKESSRVHVNDAFALRAIAAAIRNMGGGENG